MAVVFFTVYMLLPVLTSYTKVLHQKAIGDITWVWIYSARIVHDGLGTGTLLCRQEQLSLTKKRKILSMNTKEVLANEYL